MRLDDERERRTPPDRSNCLPVPGSLWQRFITFVVTEQRSGTIEFHVKDGRIISMSIRETFRDAA